VAMVARLEAMARLDFLEESPPSYRLCENPPHCVTGQAHPEVQAEACGAERGGALRPTPSDGGSTRSTQSPADEREE
jgi:hypothetical protein